MFGTLADSAMNLNLAEEVFAIIEEELMVFILRKVNEYMHHSVLQHTC